MHRYASTHTNRPGLDGWKPRRFKLMQTYSGSRGLLEFVCANPGLPAGTELSKFLASPALMSGALWKAAYGRGALAVSGFCIYVSLALGLLGSALAFPFGIFVVICQRNPEKYIQARCAPQAFECRLIMLTLL